MAGKYENVTEDQQLKWARKVFDQMGVSGWERKEHSL
jgi:hypothetical protein